MTLNPGHHLTVQCFPGPPVGFAVTSPKGSTNPRIFEKALYNRGFDMATGRFICQDPGLYLFSVTVQRDPGPSEVSCTIHINGAAMMRVAASGSPKLGYPASAATVFTRLSVGDKVYLSSCSGSHMHGLTLFSGALIQRDSLNTR